MLKFNSLKKIFITAVLFTTLLISGCGQRVTWEAAVTRGSFHYQSASDQKRLKKALDNALQNFDTLKVTGNNVAVIQVVNDKKNSIVIDLIYSKLKSKNKATVKLNERQLDKSKYDNILYVYATVFGVSQHGTIYSGGQTIAGAGDRTADVSIYTRLEDNTGKTLLEKTIEGRDNSMYAIYSYPRFDSKKAKIEQLVQQSMQGK